ncbi:MAG: hypothetical protein QME74_09000 [Candidatus Edwardsbacteria bacterium]|nr:hypothetical protein [Candidatus Edwardsbacteria bacterium]
MLLVSLEQGGEPELSPVYKLNLLQRLIDGLQDALPGRDIQARLIVHRMMEGEIASR